MMALGTCLAQDQKTERIKYIRKCYAEAKKKIDANGKNGKSPKDMRVIINRLEDEDIPLYDTEQLEATTAISDTARCCSTPRIIRSSSVI